MLLACEKRDVRFKKVIVFSCGVSLRMHMHKAIKLYIFYMIHDHLSCYLFKETQIKICRQLSVNRLALISC